MPVPKLAERKDKGQHERHLSEIRSIMKKGSALAKTEVSSPKNTKTDDKKSTQGPAFNFDEILAEYNSGMDLLKYGQDSSFFMAIKRGYVNKTAAVSPKTSFVESGGLTFQDPNANYSL
jgi:hypothetical protein